MFRFIGGTKAEAVIICLGRKNQSKQQNYAKRSQFFKKSNVYNLNKNNELQQKMDNGHLVKTNPNKANSNPFRIQCKPKTNPIKPNCLSGGGI